MPRARKRSDSLAWAEVPPPPDMSDYDRDSSDEVSSVPLPLVESGVGGAIEDWDDDAWL